jgi:hypothetical protein
MASTDAPAHARKIRRRGVPWPRRVQPRSLHSALPVTVANKLRLGMTVPGQPTDLSPSPAPTETVTLTGSVWVTAPRADLDRGCRRCHTGWRLGGPVRAMRPRIMTAAASLSHSARLVTAPGPDGHGGPGSLSMPQPLTRMIIMMIMTDSRLTIRSDRDRGSH